MSSVCPHCGGSNFRLEEKTDWGYAVKSLAGTIGDVILGTTRSQVNCRTFIGDRKHEYIYKCYDCGEKFENPIDSSQLIHDDDSEIARKVKRLIVNRLGVDITEISIDSSFTNDLGADDLDVTEIIMFIEKEFDIRIPDSKAEKIETVGDAIKYIIELKG